MSSVKRIHVPRVHEEKTAEFGSLPSLHPEHLHTRPKNRHKLRLYKRRKP